MKKIKPVLGFIKKLMNGIPTESEYLMWVGYIDGEDVWVASYDEESRYDDEIEVFENDLKKIISKNHIDVSGLVHLAEKNYKISRKGLNLLQQTSDSLINNPNFWPELSIEELKALRKKSGSVLFNESSEIRFEFKPY
jgi:hypothetical protein